MAQATFPALAALLLGGLRLPLFLGAAAGLHVSSGGELKEERFLTYGSACQDCGFNNQENDSSSPSSWPSCAVLEADSGGAQRGVQPPPLGVPPEPGPTRRGHSSLRGPGEVARLVRDPRSAAVRQGRLPGKGAVVSPWLFLDLKQRQIYSLDKEEQHAYKAQ